MANRWDGLTAEERFWSNVEKRGPDECWEWTASLQEKGYGQFNAGKHEGQKKLTVRVHRFAYELVHGPTRKKVLHSCDNRKCVNLKHLFVGTQADNIHDMIAKGRRRTRLSELQVRSVKLYLLNRWTHKKIASHFLVSRATISHIATGRLWAGVQL